ncbi:MAG: PHP domain-containing protein [Candidatus Nealsonbacteria bacterium]|nr:PHP domain-containing protein [Candidatus Nealsonbacteria bacterium]
MKIDFHTHTYYSNDGVFSPEKIIKSALKKGLDGIAITDHNTAAGWPAAIRAAKKLGAVLILGEEIKIKKNGRIVGEILGYFLTREINPKGKSAERIIEEIKKQGGLAIIAHPYHWRKPFKELEKYKNLADGVEAFNSRSQSKNGNKNVLEFAQKNNLPMTAGSDCHSPFEAGLAYVEADAKTPEEFKELILKRKVKIAGRQAPVYGQIFATIGKLIHLFLGN